MAEAKQVVIQMQIEVHPVQVGTEFMVQFQASFGTLASNLFLSPNDADALGELLKQKAKECRTKIVSALPMTPGPFLKEA
jgi:hypothetical protein